MKLTHAEFREWLDTACPEGYIFEGDTLMPDGRDALDDDIKPNEIVDLSDWEAMVWDSHPYSDEKDLHPDLSVASLIRKWRKDKTVTYFVVAVPNDHVAHFKEIAKSNGWRTK